MRYVREAVMAAIRAIVALAGWATVMAFNLEPRIAIVKEGPKGSYFGYSVAQHQVGWKTLAANIG